MKYLLFLMLTVSSCYYILEPDWRDTTYVSTYEIRNNSGVQIEIKAFIKNKIYDNFIIEKGKIIIEKNTYKDSNRDEHNQYNLFKNDSLYKGKRDSVVIMFNNKKLIILKNDLDSFDSVPYSRIDICRIGQQENRTKRKNTYDREKHIVYIAPYAVIFTPEDYKSAKPL